jgi:hypothetical protein
MFVSELLELQSRALEYIRSILKKRGTEYQIIDPATYEDGYDEDENTEEERNQLWALPRGKYVTKHGFYEEYPIVMINIDEEDKLTFLGIGCIGDGADEEKIFTDEDLSTPTICAIADIVSALED